MMGILAEHFAVQGGLYHRHPNITSGKGTCSRVSKDKIKIMNLGYLRMSADFKLTMAIWG